MSKFKKPVELSIPEAYELGFCTVGQSSEFPFTIFNPNAKPLNYLFKFTEFIISPSKGILMPNSYSSFRIEFKTDRASVTVGTVVLEVEGENQRVIKLSAVGKYPYITTNISQVDFGSVLVTRTTGRQVVLKNSSEVPADFRIQALGIAKDFNDCFYSFQPQQGSIPPKTSFAVQINYTPGFVDTTNINNFKMVCANGNDLPLILHGKSRRFNVYFNTNSINFGQIKLENSCNKVLTINNESELDTQFEFFTDSGNVFCFNQIRGTVGRSSTRKIIIQFRPRNTIAYYERVYCLVRNHVLLYIDLLGTCYDLLIRPVPLMQVHVDTFRKRVVEGRISAIQLKYIQNNLLLKLAKRGQEEKGSQQNFYQSTLQLRQHPYILHKQLFLSNQHNQLLSLNADFIEFGYCDVMTLSSQREIQVTNRLPSRLTLNWISQKRQNLNGQYMTVFQVFPQSAVLKPNVPVKFHITFRPLKANNYYSQHLQFFASRQNSKISKKTLEQFQYKQLKAKPETTLLRNVKLTQTIQSKVKEDIQSTQILPPIAGVVRCLGHSFSHSSLPFLPIMKLLPSKITFKPCLRGHSTYDSVELVNQSDTPIYFKFGPDPNKVFRAQPRIGLIQPKGFVVVALEFTPKQYKLYQSTINVSLNDLPGSGAKLSLTGLCTEPQLSFQNEGKIYFAPTFTGVCTKKSFKITNLSKSRLTYRVLVPQKYRQELSFQPAERQLEANQSFNLNAFFVPQQKRKYKISVPVEAIEDSVPFNLEVGYHNPGSASNQKFPEQQSKAFSLQVYGQGSDGSIQISQEQLNFGTVKISEQKKLQFKLKNTANCAFFIDVRFQNNRFEEGYSPPSESHLMNVFGLDFKEGTLPANSEITVGIAFNPTQIHKYDLQLVVTARQKIPKNSTLKLKGNQGASKCTMRIVAEGNYPLMEIIDIRNDVLSVAALWENFQMSKINGQLGCELDNYQKKYLSVETLTFSQTKSLEEKLKHYDWNLGYVSTKNKSKPRKVLITVKNYGGTPLNYKFKFPSDNKVPQQLWADPGEPTEQEAYEKAILQNNIFQIRPKVARLQPGQVKDIELIYSPVSLQGLKTSTSSQIHFLKVVFQIQNGKSLVFNLKGTTLGPNQGLLTVKKNNYKLPQIPIGLSQPMRFPIELNNVGSIKVNYKTEIKYQEGEVQQVFSIQNPNHFLLAGQNHYIYCLYKPLIKKKYRFTVLVHVFDFNKQIQVIQLNVQGESIKSQGQNNKIAKNLKADIGNTPMPGQRTTVSEVGSKVFFSIQELDFQSMEANSTKYHMIILYNMSKQLSLTYDFPTQSTMNQNKTALTCGDKFVIQPAQGILEPQKFIELKITLTSSNSVSFYEGEIPCHITWASNKYSTQDNDLTQKDVMMTAQKESLFLRIKKRSVLQKKSDQPLAIKNDPKKSLLQQIFQNMFVSTLNDPQLESMLEKMEEEEIPLAQMLDENPSVSIGAQFEQESQVAEARRDYSNFESVLLNEQFLEVTQIIMQNTFFNIVQETTHQENDFLRVGKKFIQANRM